MMGFWAYAAIPIVMTVLAAAAGVHVLVAASMGFAATFILAAVTLGGTAESFAATAGYLSPYIAVATIIAVGVGYGIRTLFGGGSLIRTVTRELMPAPLAETCEQAAHVAADQFRSGSRTGIRCPECRATPDVDRVATASGSEPDIRVSCRCGGCSAQFPFRRRSTKQVLQGTSTQDDARPQNE